MASGFSWKHTTSVIGGFTLLFTWLHARPILEHSYLADSDLYEFFLPVFLSPITTWSSYEFGGMPAFADPGDSSLYPLHFLFARILGSWTGLIISAYVVGASAMYAYVYSLTRSRLAAASSGLAFGLSEALMEQAAHLTTLHAIAWVPLILLSIDQLRRERPWTWMAIGACACANCFLAGHPQPVLYAGYVCATYALLGGLASGAGLRYYLSAIVMVAVGAAIASVKLIPALETSLYTARQTVNVSQFVGHSNTPAQMLSLLFPDIEHEGREAPTYVGVATLLFAFVAARLSLRNWRIVFWIATAVIALLIGAGDATPVAELAFRLPFSDKFRVGARYLLLAAIALTTLAGVGVAAVQRGEVSRRVVWIAAVTVCLMFGAGAAALGQWPDRFTFDDNATIQVQLLLVGVSILACLAFAVRPRARWTTVALLIVLAVDLIHAVPYDVTSAGLDLTRIPAEATQPSVHASRLAAGLEPRRQRLLAVAGTSLDDVVPAAFARLWRISIAGGYSPMMLARYGTLATMNANGSVEPQMLYDDNVALDLLAVKYVLMRAEDLSDPGTSERHGLRWSTRPLQLPVGPDECGQRHPRTASYMLPQGLELWEVALVTHLRCSESVPQGDVVATLKVIGEGGVTHEWPIRAGIETAEQGLRDAGLRRRARHMPATLFDPAEEAYTYYSRFTLPQPARGARLEITVTGTAGWLELDRLTAIDAAGEPHPQNAPDIFLFNGSRWREAGRFMTSRLTDRSADEAGENETESRVFENVRALPRAWMVREVIPLSEEEQLDAVHHSYLPDGRRFDPQAMALVDAGALPAARSFDTGAASAEIREIRDGLLSVAVSTSGGGFLVLSDAFYPGWRARTGSQTLPLYRADLALRGVIVPPGAHLITMEFASDTLRTGRIISAAGGLMLLLFVWFGFRERGHAR